MMKKMITIALALSLSMSLLTTGCSAPSSKKDSKKAKQEETIVYSECVTLPDYQSISLNKTKIDSECETLISQTLEQYATYDKVTKGTVKDGDVVNINYVGKMDGEEFEGGAYKAEDYPDGYDLTIGSNNFIDGFEEALIGKKIGKTYDIDVTFPESYPANPDYAGKPAVFTVTLNSKQGKKHEAKLDDAFVSKYLSNYSSAKEYKQKTRESIVESEVWTWLQENAVIKEYPKSLIKEVKSRLKSSINYYLSQQNLKMEDYLNQMQTTEKDFDAQLEETAKQNVGDMILSNAIGEKENISFTEEEYKNQLDLVMQNNNLTDEKAVEELFDNYYGSTPKKILSEDLLKSNVTKYLVTKVKEVEEEGKEDE